MTPKKLSSFLFLLIIIGSTLFGCSIDKSKLAKVKGTDLTYSEYFKTYDYLDQRKNVTYYKPFLIN